MAFDITRGGQNGFGLRGEWLLALLIHTVVYCKLYSIPNHQYSD